MEEEPFRADEEFPERVGRLDASKDGRVRTDGRDSGATVDSDDGPDS